MTLFFKRQLTDYAEYHRNEWNSVMHVIGIVLLFLGALLPVSSVTIQVFGIRVVLAALLVLPVLVYWLFLDTVLGLGIACFAGLFLWTASTIVDHISPVGMWIVFAGLVVAGVAAQIVGHQVFERRQPALIDNPGHFLMGPMFVMAKLFIALGLRPDLADILRQASSEPSTMSTRQL